MAATSDSPVFTRKIVLRSMTCLKPSSRDTVSVTGVGWLSGRSSRDDAVNQLSALRAVDESAAPPPMNATMPPITVRMPLVTRLRKRRRLTSAVAVSTVPVAIGTLEDPLLGNRVLVLLAVLVEAAIPLEHF